MIAKKMRVVCLALLIQLSALPAIARVDCLDRANVLEQSCETVVYQPEDASYRDRYLQPSNKSLPPNRRASSLAAFKRQLAVLQPGDVLEVDDAIWVDAGTIEIKAVGSPARPITIRAKRSGGVVFEGFATIRLSGSNVRFEGFAFHGAFKAPKSHGLTTIVLGSFKEPCMNCLVDSVSFENYNAESPAALIGLRHRYIATVGKWNRISRSSFDNKRGFGQLLAVNKPNRDDKDNTLIDRNYFANIPVGKKNGYETIAVGIGQSWTDSDAIIENNLFYRTQGEPEFISLKANGVVIRGNTFIQNARTITLRAADNVVIEGNVFIGDHVPQTGGIRIYGSNHVIAHNIFQSLDGEEASNHAISIMAGQKAIAPSPGWYKPVSRVAVVFNLFADNKANWIVGGRAMQKLADTEPRDVVFGYNDIVSRSASVASDIGPGAQVHFLENHCSPAAVNERHVCMGQASAALQGGIYVPNAKSPVVVANRVLYRTLDISPALLAKMSYVNMAPSQPIHFRRIERTDVGPDS